MSSKPHLIVEQGPDKGRAITVPPQGARVGRSSRNDIVLSDPSLSRHHCRLFFKTGDGLWITDLGSSNATVVNGNPVQEAALRRGDRITLGDTVLQVLEDARESLSLPGEPSPAVDLGLSRPRETPATARRHLLAPLVVVAILLALLAAVVWIPKFRQGRSPAVTPLVSKTPLDDVLEIMYEKVQADARNIFRYELQVDARGILSVRIDDLANQRHVRKEKPVDRLYLAQLARQIENAGFFALDEKYEGLQPGILERWDLSVTVGRRTHRSLVVNRLEPDAFRAAREMIEQFGKNELGLWAIQFSQEKLLDLAREAFLLGQKLFGEREIKYGNLYAAMQSFTEAEWYLETVEPKPDFYADIIAGRNQCKEVLDEKYNERNFRAERAIRLRQWPEAAAELRVLLDLIPDRGDPRHQEARKKLLDVETRLRGNR